MVHIKRIYEAPSLDDGYRILIDRLWPRGVSKESAALDLWLKEIAPTPELRTWFGHAPERFEEFKARYEIELEQNPALTLLRDLIKQHKNVTLLYAAHDPQINHAVVLRDYLAR